VAAVHVSITGDLLRDRKPDNHAATKTGNLLMTSQHNSSQET